MTRVFVDTSALVALLDGDDPRNLSVRTAFAEHRDDEPVTHGYVVVESLAVIRRRLGIEAAIALLDDVLPSIQLLPVDLPLHVEAQRRYRAALPTGVSLVDQISLAVIARDEIPLALVVDSDFASPDLQIIPT